MPVGESEYLVESKCAGANGANEVWSYIIVQAVVNMVAIWGEPDDYREHRERLGSKNRGRPEQIEPLRLEWAGPDGRSPEEEEEHAR